MVGTFPAVTETLVIREIKGIGFDVTVFALGSVHFTVPESDVGGARRIC